MTARILSVFNLLKRVGFVFLLLGGGAFAQPFDVLWDRSGQGPESGYGARVFSLGDQNNDGFMDWGVSAQGLVAGDPSEEMAEFFYGGNPPQTTPYHIFVAEPEIHRSGGYVITVGDINGDGFEDWYVSYQYANNAQMLRFEFHHGGPDATFEPIAVVHRPLGTGAISPIGDFNGDGYDDLYISRLQPYPDGFMLFGGIQLDTIPDLFTSSGELLMAASGDLNGDGYSDFMDTDRNVYMGSATPDLVPEYHWEGTPSSTKRIIPDLNGDGRDELAIARPGSHIDIHLGADVLPSTPDVTLNFQGCSEGGIYNIVGLGDINNDWHSDFAAIDDWCINGWGAIAVYLGYHWINPNPVATIRGRTEPYNLVGIHSAAGLGDVNGDEIGDFIVGAWNDDFDGERGRAVVFAGSDEYVVPADEVRLFPEQLDVSVYPNPFNSSATVSLELPPSARSVSLTLFNTLGQEVRKEELNFVTTSMQYRLDGQGLATGLYFLMVQAGNLVQTNKLVVLK